MRTIVNSCYYCGNVLDLDDSDVKVTSWVEMTFATYPVCIECEGEH